MLTNAIMVVVAILAVIFAYLDRFHPRQPGVPGERRKTPWLTYTVFALVFISCFGLSIYEASTAKKETPIVEPISEPQNLATDDNRQEAAGLKPAPPPVVAAASATQAPPKQTSYGTGSNKETANPPAAPKLPTSYHNNRFDVRMVACVNETVTRCTLTVTASSRSLWDYSEQNRLITADRTIKAATLSVAGELRSLPNRYSAPIEAGTTVKIVLEFPEAVPPDTVQALDIYIGHWTAKTVPLAPIWSQS